MIDWEFKKKPHNMEKGKEEPRTVPLGEKKEKKKKNGMVGACDRLGEGPSDYSNGRSGIKVGLRSA